MTDAKRFGSFLLLGLLVLVAAGCSSGDKLADLREYTAQVKARPVPPIEPLPEIKPYETFVYEAQDLRDPFQPPRGPEPEQGVVAGSGGGPSPDFNRPREPLEMFPLDSMRMVGTLEQAEQIWAIVKANDGTIHRIRDGNYLGQNHGRIEQISEQEIVLTELVPNGRGGWLERPASLALKE